MTEESNIQFGNEFNRRAESQGVLVSSRACDDDVAVAVLSRAQGIVQAPKRNKVDGRMGFRVVRIRKRGKIFLSYLKHLRTTAGYFDERK